MEVKQKFLELYSGITRPGAKELITYLTDKSDFFTAPASTRFHLSHEGGLAEHSLNVGTLMTRYTDENPESLLICGLLHDMCKINFYKRTTRNVKNEKTGQWEKQPYYTIEDAFPFGHGEKSVYLIERFMRLKPAEAVAIRWHMGGFDDSVKGGGSMSIGAAFERYPLAVKLHLCDIEASYLIESRKEPTENF